MIRLIRVFHLSVLISLIKFSFEYSLQQASCLTGYVRCENGENYESYEYGDRCIKEEDVCDGKFHCSDSSDEKYCPNNFNFRRNGFVIKFVTGGCDKYSKMCLSGKVQAHYSHHYPNKRCFNNWWFCQSISVCNDESDRMFCPYDTTLDLFHYQFSQFGCDKDFYKCKEGRVKYTTSLASGYCIHKSLICDGLTDCIDKSDEKYCPYVFNYKTEEINFKPYDADEETTFMGSSTLETTSSDVSSETATSLEPSTDTADYLDTRTDLITEISSPEKAKQSDTSNNKGLTSPTTQNILDESNVPSDIIENHLKTTSPSKTSEQINIYSDKQKVISKSEPFVYHLIVNSYMIVFSQIIIIVLLVYKIFYKHHSEGQINQNEYNLTSLM